MTAETIKTKEEADQLGNDLLKEIKELSDTIKENDKIKDVNFEQLFSEEFLKHLSDSVKNELLQAINNINSTGITKESQNMLEALARFLKNEKQNYTSEEQAISNETNENDRFAKKIEEEKTEEIKNTIDKLLGNPLIKGTTTEKNLKAMKETYSNGGKGMRNVQNYLRKSLSEDAKNELKTQFASKEGTSLIIDGKRVDRSLENALRDGVGGEVTNAAMMKHLDELQKKLTEIETKNKTTIKANIKAAKNSMDTRNNNPTLEGTPTTTPLEGELGTTNFKIDQFNGFGCDEQINNIRKIINVDQRDFKENVNPQQLTTLRGRMQKKINGTADNNDINKYKKIYENAPKILYIAQQIKGIVNTLTNKLQSNQLDNDKKGKLRAMGFDVKDKNIIKMNEDGSLFQALEGLNLFDKDTFKASFEKGKQKESRGEILNELAKKLGEDLNNDEYSNWKNYMQTPNLTSTNSETEQRHKYMRKAGVNFDSKGRIKSLDKDADIRKIESLCHIKITINPDRETDKVTITTEEKPAEAVTSTVVEGATEVQNNAVEVTDQNFDELCGLEGLSEDQIKGLVNYANNKHETDPKFELSLDIKEINKNKAEILAKYKGNLSLNNITKFTSEENNNDQLAQDIAEALARHEGGDLELCKLENLSEKAAEKLAKHKGELRLLGLDLTTSLLETFLGREQYLNLSHTKHKEYNTNERMEKFKDKLFFSIRY